MTAEQKELIDVFRKNYSAIQASLSRKHISFKAYDANREKGSPTLDTILRRCGFKSYHELLLLCGYEKEKSAISISYSVSYNDTEDSTKLLTEIIRGHNEAGDTKD